MTARSSATIASMPAFDPDAPETFAPAHLAETPDPYAIFEALHRAGPTLASDAGFRLVHGYEAVQAMLRDRRFKSGPIARRFEMTLPPGAARDELAHRINFLDAPDHSRVRRLILRAFTPRRVREMRPWIERTTEAILDGVDPEQPFDLRRVLAHALPSWVISEMLGVPHADRDTLTEWTEAVTPLLSPSIDPDDLDAGLEASERFAAYAADLVDERRGSPGEDLLTAILLSEDGEETLGREELLSLFVTLYSAGHRTTRDLFANGLHALLERPDDYAAVAADPRRVPAVVQEMLRYETPTLYVARVPTEPAEIAGDEIGPFTPTLILLAAANRDPSAYDAPNRFDIDRFTDGSKAPAPLSFAAGPHHCLGAALARMEAEVMLAAVLRRWPRLELASSAAWWSRGPFRGLERLEVVPG